jgi:hypothetical protein
MGEVQAFGKEKQTNIKFGLKAMSFLLKGRD